MFVLYFVKKWILLLYLCMWLILLAGSSRLPQADNQFINADICRGGKCVLKRPRTLPRAFGNTSDWKDVLLKSVLHHYTLSRPVVILSKSTTLTKKSVWEALENRLFVQKLVQWNNKAPHYWPFVSVSIPWRHPDIYGHMYMYMCMILQVSWSLTHWPLVDFNEILEK